MKKKMYIKPAMQVHSMEPIVILAGSDPNDPYEKIPTGGESDKPPY